ncbi:MAG: DUF3024 domain-containing protein [Chloroflexia bacterium]|nr:DUF3024 domain-containing protein [Chloroflexia bacterium]
MTNIDPTLELPEKWVLIAHFVLPWVKLWDQVDEISYQEGVRRIAGFGPNLLGLFERLVFCFRCTVSESREPYPHLTPAVKDIPKLIIDAFRGILYPEDNLNYVCAVQVEAAWGPDELEQTEVWIYDADEEEEEEEEEEALFYREEWDEQRAHSRSIEQMRRIALDALEFGDDDPAYYTYAEEHNLSVDELVYYLNAYEYGGEAGLRAIRNPDIIPPDIARRAVRTIEKTLAQVPQLSCRVTDEGTAIGVYQIQERWQTEEPFLFAICQFRLSLAENQWHLYWMRKFDAWWPYEPPQKGRRYTLNARLQQLLEDEYGCFWV